MPILFHTLLVAIHLLTVAVGLGAALLADWIALQLVCKTITSIKIAKLCDLSRAVTTGVLLLWISGAALVWFDTIADTGFLLNQKIWAKVIIVTLLSLNAILLHKLVLPLASAQIGQTMFKSTNWTRRICCTLAASVSLVSWLSALLLGVARELNGIVTVGHILVVYVTVLSLVWCVLLVFIVTLSVLTRSRVGPQT